MKYRYPYSNNIIEVHYSADKERQFLSETQCRTKQLLDDRNCELFQPQRSSSVTKWNCKEKFASTHDITNYVCVYNITLYMCKLCMYVFPTKLMVRNSQFRSEQGRC